MKKQNVIGYRIVLGLLILLNVLFLVYYIGLAIYNRLHFDDLNFLWHLREMTTCEYVVDKYLNWSGRFVGYFLNALHSNFILQTGWHWLLPLIYYTLGIICTYIPLRKYMPNNAFAAWNAIVLFYNIYVLTNIDYPSFTWICAMAYLVFMPFTFMLWHLIQKQVTRWYEWIIMMLFALFLGGGHEAFTPMVLGLYFCYGLYLLYGYAWTIKDAWHDIRVKKLIGAAAVILIAWIIVVIAPGNYVRMDEAGLGSSVGFIGLVKGYVSVLIMLAYFEAFYVPYYFILVGLFVLVGYWQKDKIQIPFSYKSLMWTSLLMWVGYVAISIIPFVYLWGGVGFQRNYTPIVFISLFTFCFWGFILGYYKLKSHVKLTTIFVAIGLCILIGIQTYNNVADLPTACQYSKAVDERVEYLQCLEAEGQTETVVVKRIESPFCLDAKFVISSVLGRKTNKPVLYYISEEVPDEYIYHFKKVYGLSFDFVIEQSEE